MMRERDTLIGCIPSVYPYMPPPGIKPSTLACALLWLRIRAATIQPTEPFCPGCSVFCMYSKYSFRTINVLSGRLFMVSTSLFPNLPLLVHKLSLLLCPVGLLCVCFHVPVAPCFNYWRILYSERANFSSALCFRLFFHRSVGWFNLSKVLFLLKRRPTCICTWFVFNIHIH